MDKIYGWKVGHGSRTFSRNSEAPTREEHCRWIVGLVDSVKDWSWMIVCDDHDVGVARVEWKGNAYAPEISILMGPDSRGQGIGTEAVKLVRRVYRGRLWTFIQHGNVILIRAFYAAGFEAIDKNRWYCAPSATDK